VNTLRRTSHRGRSPRRAGTLIGLALAAIAVLALPGLAAASDTVICDGKLLPKKIPALGAGLEYEFSCEASNPVDGSGTITAYSISVNRSVDYFSPETIGLDENGDPSGEQFACQGSIPSWGFGCSRGTGSMLPGHTMTGDFATEKKPCKGGKLIAWVSATSTQTNHFNNTTYTDISEPYRFRGPNCGDGKRRHRNR
jgi:hypothetical protein